MVSEFLGSSSLERKSGGETVQVAGCSAGGVTAGGVAALGAGAGGVLAEESTGGSEAVGDANSFDAWGGEVANATKFCSSGVPGPEWTGGPTGSSDGGGEVGGG